jgi:hypothetical protein
MKKLIIQFLLRKVLLSILKDKKLQKWISKQEVRAEASEKNRIDDILIDTLKFAVDALKKMCKG